MLNDRKCTGGPRGGVTHEYERIISLENLLGAWKEFIGGKRMKTDVQEFYYRFRVKYYIRYADDFVALSHDRKYLVEILRQMRRFLNEKLSLTMHPKKVHIRTFASGVDFLGWVHFPDHRVIRTSTKRRAIRNVQNGSEVQRIYYKALLAHGNTKKLVEAHFRAP